MVGALQSPRAWVACDPEARARLLEFLSWAYRYARAARLLLSRLEVKDATHREQLWNHALPVTPARWFGTFSADRFQFVNHVFHAVLDRFERGFEDKGMVRFVCLTETQERCDRSVLANAREFGTVRICPRLLQKEPRAGGVVMLHEILHQGFGVADRRHAVCRRGHESRCYRAGARRLVNAGLSDIAIRNNDNYAYFARAAYRALDAHALGKDATNV